ncbi:MAG: PQQ-dependent sugar dehydrogenase, partial [Verrucomicrobiota bacterium]
MPRIIVIFSLLFAASSTAAETEFTRKPWTSSRVEGSPDPPKPYIAERVYEELNIAHGLEMMALDGRLLVLTRKGIIYSFVEDEDTTQLDVFADLKAHQEKLGHAYGMVLHPKWRENQTMFVSYTVGGADPEEGTRVSRFTFDAGDVTKLNVASEEIIYTWRSGGHNGANLQFGPDGMLYISTGDATEPSPPDKLNTGQDNSDVLSAVLRIDVDNQDEGAGFRIPPDNPFVGRENVRPEIWAFGFRNPWKMSFDSKGRLWLGDVGWELWEMIHLVEKGGNYGWSAMEATQPIKPETAGDLAPISPPAAAHAHTEAASITGGYEYTGERLQQLRGAYVYGDYETGKIWALRHDGTKPGLPEEIADTPHRISTFGVGNAGNLYYIHYDDPSSIFRLSPNPAVGKPNEFPRKLSQTGIFSDVGQQLPNDGVYEFQIHEPMWQDGAETKRYIALPNDGEVHTTIEQAGRKITTTWPEGAVLAKTISLRETPIETQMLHFDGNQWHGYAYRWNEAATDAEVVEADGVEFEVKPNLWKGGATYRIASRAECFRCHNMWNQFTPAFEPMQLAGFRAFPEQPAREVAVGLGLTNANFFAKNQLGELASSRGRGSLERKSRSWLHANCAHCHRRHGGGSSPLEINFERDLSATATLWEKPTRGDFGLDDAHIFTPGA